MLGPCLLKFVEDYGKFKGQDLKKIFTWCERTAMFRTDAIGQLSIPAPLPKASDSYTRSILRLVPYVFARTLVLWEHPINSPSSSLVFCTPCSSTFKSFLSLKFLLTESPGPIDPLANNPFCHKDRLPHWGHAGLDTNNCPRSCEGYGASLTRSNHQLVRDVPQVRPLHYP